MNLANFVCPYLKGFASININRRFMIIISSPPVTTVATASATITPSPIALPDARAYVGDGTSDPDIAFIALRNSAGVQVFIYPNSTGNGLVVSTVHP